MKPAAGYCPIIPPELKLTASPGGIIGDCRKLGKIVLFYAAKAALFQ
jgi:hypothetical protein